MTNELKPLVPLLCCDIPSVYSNKQSYYECLCYIGYKVNECIEAINGFTDAYKQYTDEKIAGLKKYIDNLNTDIYKHITEVEKNIRDDMNAKDTELDEKINKVQTQLLDKIGALNILIYDLNDETRAHIDTEVKKLYDYINDYMPNNMEVLNPVKGYRTSLNQALSDMYDNLRYYALTCNEFDSLNLTCTEFDNLLLSCTEFDLYGAKRFRVDSNLYMHNPFTGEYVFYQDVIYQLAQLHFNNPINASEFDGLLLTVTGFEAKALSAYTFDSNAKTALQL
jgi:ribosome-associated translation inhibitor RaiA|nr:MAG TPA: apolipoprotein [Caudoviricetes sp.]